MKKIVIISLSICLIAVSACKKNSAGPGGSWKFKNITYQSNFSNFVLGSFTGSTVDGFPTGTVNFTFSHPPDSTYPRAGVYIPTNTNTPDSAHVYVLLTDSSAARDYVATGSGIVTVVRQNGKVNIAFPSVELSSTSNPADSAVLSGNLYQTP